MCLLCLARLNDSVFYNTPAGVANSAPLPSYDALNDPHLAEYFTRKFAYVNSIGPHPPKGVSWSDILLIHDCQKYMSNNWAYNKTKQ